MGFWVSRIQALECTSLEPLESQILGPFSQRIDRVYQKCYTSFGGGIYAG